MNAIILSIGDELVLGQVTDTNAAWLGARLAELGIMTVWHQTVPDDRAAVAGAFHRAAAAAPLVVVSGGLGPTPDDLTREALADALGAPLRLHAPAREQIEKFFRARGYPMPERNLSQAMLPAGAESLENPAGTAPGIHARLGASEIFVVPGVPREMRTLFDLHIAPRLRAQSGRVILTARLDTFGTGESLIAEQLGELMDRTRNPLVGTTAGDGIVSVRIRADFPGAASARAAMDQTKAAVCERLGTTVFGDGGVTMAEVTGQLLRRHGRRLITAESCTGGLLGKMLTDMSGSSDFYAGGWVVYDNAMKTGQLGVSADILRADGAVSESVARAMAEGALRRTLTDCVPVDYALAITGIAGPDGGAPAKPVGTVWLAMSERIGGEMVTRAGKYLWPGDRSMVRDRAANAALNMLRLRLLSHVQGRDQTG